MWQHLEKACRGVVLGGKDYGTAEPVGVVDPLPSLQNCMTGKLAGKSRTSLGKEVCPIPVTGPIS